MNTLAVPTVLFSVLCGWLGGTAAASAGVFVHDAGKLVRLDQAPTLVAQPATADEHEVRWLVSDLPSEALCTDSHPRLRISRADLDPMDVMFARLYPDWDRDPATLTSDEVPHCSLAVQRNGESIELKVVADSSVLRDAVNGIGRVPECVSAGRYLIDPGVYAVYWTKPRLEVYPFCYAPGNQDGAKFQYAVFQMCLEHDDRTRPAFDRLKASSDYYRFLLDFFAPDLLASCDDNSVLLTDGDEDTFGCWYAQLYGGLKRSVLVTSVSTLHSRGWVKRMKRKGLPILAADLDIDRSPVGVQQSDGEVCFFRDVMLRAIVAGSGHVPLSVDSEYKSSPEQFCSRVFTPAYRPSKPVYFAWTVGYELRAWLEQHLQMEGLVYRVVPLASAAPSRIDTARSRRLLFEEFRTNPSRGRLPGSDGYCANYAAAYMAYATALSEAGRYEDALNAMAGAYRLPLSATHTSVLAMSACRIAFRARDYALALAWLDSVDVSERRVGASVCGERGRVYLAMADTSRAESAYRRALDTSPADPEHLRELVSFYVAVRHDTTAAVALLDERLRVCPSDEAASALLQQIRP